MEVKVGSVDHPMTPEHYIEWVCIETEEGGQCKKLNPGKAPTATFALKDDKVIAIISETLTTGRQ